MVVDRATSGTVLLKSGILQGLVLRSLLFLLYNNISLTDFDGQLMAHILHKGSSTNSCHCIYMIKVGDIWFKCDNVKITKIEFDHFCNSNTVYMLFYKRSA